ncbi:Uridylate cyclase [Dirofilaria immitis]
MKQNKNYKNDERANGSPKTVAATMVADNGIRETYMMCKEVRLINSNEAEKAAMALILLDMCSDCSYVTESIANKLKLKQTSPSEEMLIMGMIGRRKCGSRNMIFGKWESQMYY